MPYRPIGDFSNALLALAQQEGRATDTINPAGNQFLRKFVEQGILTEITGRKRNRKFSYQDYIELFNENAGA